MKTRTWTAAIAAAAALAVCAPAQAETFKDKSRVTACTPSTFVEDVKRPDGSFVRRSMGACITTSDLPFPFDHMRLLCSGVAEFAADGKLISSHGFCDGTSTKGDRVATWNVFDPVNQGRWGFFNGSGAYAGIKGSGTHKLRAGFPGGGAVYDVIGSWETGSATATK